MSGRCRGVWRWRLRRRGRWLRGRKGGRAWRRRSSSRTRGRRRFGWGVWCAGLVRWGVCHCWRWRKLLSGVDDEGR